MDGIQVQRKQKQCINFELIKINYNFSPANNHRFISLTVASTSAHFALIAGFRSKIGPMSTE